MEIEVIKFSDFMKGKIIKEKENIFESLIFIAGMMVVVYISIKLGVPHQIGFKNILSM
jgi:hypothetical protein